MATDVDLMMPIQLRKAAALADELANRANDPEADAQLELEARREEQIIQSVCGELGLTMYEVRPYLWST